MEKKIAFILCCLLVTASFAAKVRTSTDSHRLRPPDVNPGRLRGFVLASGGYPVLCRGGGLGCIRQVTNEQCPAGYSPSVVTAVVAGGGGCPIKRIYMQPQHGELVSLNGGYSLKFQHAYIDPSLCPGPYPVTINYSVYCR